jgi:hypothetical protein
MKSIPTIEELGFQGESLRFQNHLTAFLLEAYGIERCPASIEADIRLFTNAQKSVYAGDTNNLMGSIQLCPGRTVGGRVVTCVPSTTTQLAFCDLLYDSLAFSEVLQGARKTPEEALDRQLSTFHSLKQKPRTTWLVSYDRLAQRGQPESSEANIKSLRETIDGAHYLASKRQVLESEPFTLVLVCQGSTPKQYVECTSEILSASTPQDVIGLGGWATIGKEPYHLASFWETMNQVLPLVKSAGVSRVHLFGVAWYRGRKAPLAPLLHLCDGLGLALSTDSTSPILNALRKDQKKAGAIFSNWRVNLAYTKARLSTIRDSEEYQAQNLPLFGRL